MYSHRAGGEAEVGRYQTLAPGQGRHVWWNPPTRAGTGITPSTLDAETVVKTLPDIASDVQVGGGGRYLIFHLTKLKKLAVFDVNEAAIIHYISLTEDKIVFAAGLEKVVVGLTAKGVLEIWDLKTGEKDLTRTLPNAADINSVLIGSASRGPLVVNGSFFDLHSLKPLPIKTPYGFRRPGVRFQRTARFSAVGRPTSRRPRARRSCSKATNSSTITRGDRDYVVPGPDGLAVYTAGGVREQPAGRSERSARQAGICLPAVEGNFFLSLTPAGAARVDASGSTCSVAISLW